MKRKKDVELGDILGKEPPFHRDAVVFMMRDGQLICPICGTELVDNDCPFCNPLGIEIVSE